MDIENLTITQAFESEGIEITHKNGVIYIKEESQDER